jgi:hypothetical protein
MALLSFMILEIGILVSFSQRIAVGPETATLPVDFRDASD